MWGYIRIYLRASLNTQREREVSIFLIMGLGVMGPLHLAINREGSFLVPSPCTLVQP